MIWVGDNKKNKIGAIRIGGLEASFRQMKIIIFLT